MIIPSKEDCIHSPVCKYDDDMCPCDCGYFEDGGIKMFEVSCCKCQIAGDSMCKHLSHLLETGECSFFKHTPLTKADKYEWLLHNLRTFEINIGYSPIKDHTYKQHCINGYYGTTFEDALEEAMKHGDDV